MAKIYSSPVIAKAQRLYHPHGHLLDKDGQAYDMCYPKEAVLEVGGLVALHDKIHVMQWITNRDYDSYVGELSGFTLIRLYPNNEHQDLSD